MNATDAVLRLSDLSLGYPAHGPSPAVAAVRGVSLRVEPGQVVGMLGESGSGTSSIARLVGQQGLAPGRGPGAPSITGGSIALLGTELRRASARRLDRLRSEVGYLAQDAAATLDPHRSTLELVAEPLQARLRRGRELPDELRQRVRDVLVAVELPPELLRALPHELSRGQRQRVAIARAIVTAPRLLVADDLAAGLDPAVRPGIVRTLAGLRRLEGFAALVISHDLDVLEPLVDRLDVLHRGEIVGSGTVAQVLDDPWHPYVRRLAQLRAER